MLNKSWREKTWSDLNQAWDIIVIGGGITGAGIFNMAAQKGLRVLLLEAKDFAFGTSSRSSKLVHGGIRYLSNRQYDVVRESVRERERLIKESHGLVDPLAFIFPSYENHAHKTKMMKLGVIVYDLMAPKWQHRTLNKTQVKNDLPVLNGDKLVGGIKYYDSLVDDSQLVLRVITDGIRYGGSALNYARVTGFLQTQNSRVEGLIVQDETGTIRSAPVEIHAKVIINATGPWSDKLREKIGGSPKLRPLRGSHLIFSNKKLPLQAAVTMLHPRDNRAMFAIPWENRTLIGTTDLDHAILEDETRITQSEVDYLMEAVKHAFPKFPVDEGDIISTFSGLRPVINTNAPTPSKESRAHQVWEDNGLVTVAGGKLTIFRVMAADVLNYCRDRLPNQPKFDHRTPCFIQPKPEDRHQGSNPDWIMMAGRLGKDVNQFFRTADEIELQKIDSMESFWAELAWAAENEAVVHLDDLLLRRVRMGLLLPGGGLDKINQIRSLTQTPLGWSDQAWESEVDRYQQIWQENYSLPH
jgi:glycerol-3-phosphate dehydrogenase